MHNVHTKYHEIPSSHSLVIKYVQTTIASLGLDWVGLGYVRLAHAQMIINSSVINIAPHDFKQPSCWY
jgi:hypothetical protein